ncbi:MAG TPA: DnaJ C-terminal domain-containing protein [Solimonas sp.]|nr:DnaJ C-terminal domain-containing protein [Solimonas sp.]
MEYKDYYKVLGVSRTATGPEIKRAYRKLARQFHPDKNKAKGAEDRFKEVNEANEVLGDPAKRKQYDELGADWKAGQRFTPPPGWHGGPGGARARGASGYADFSDFFSTLFGAAGNPAGGGGSPFGGGRFGDFGGGGGGGFESQQDMRARLAISLEDSYEGAQKQLNLGNGRTLQVRIPKGVVAGKVIRLAEQGQRGGDLLLEVDFAPHPVFKVDGRDVHATVNVAPWEAALGAKVPIPTLGGTVELTLPAGSQNGKKMRLKGRGLPGSTPGDQFVTFSIVTPAAEDSNQRELYEQMAKAFDGFDPRTV